MVSIVDGGWVFLQELQSMDLNEYISIKYGIIGIIVLMFYDLLDLGVWDREVGEGDRQG